MTDPSAGDPPLRMLSAWQQASAGTHLLVASLVGLLFGGAVGVAYSWKLGGLVAWVAAATVFLFWTWTALGSLDARDTATLAQREDPSRALRDLVLLGVAALSMIAVALVIVPAGRSGWPMLVLGVTCVVVSWMVVPTVYMLRYARLFYAEPIGGLTFNQEGDPTHRDFAYVAFTIAMTFQVSDTEVRSTAIRTTVLGQALLSFLFSAIIIAVTINVIGGMSR